MVQWTNVDANTGAPKYVTNATTGQTGVQEYGTAVFGNKPAETAAGAGSPGWTRVVEGQGSITGILIVNGGTGYANGEIVEFGDDSAEITTNANGTITSLEATITGGLISEIPGIVIDTVSGDDAVLQLTAVGKIGRVSVETLVAMRGII